jgi:hypothetical protein
VADAEDRLRNARRGPSFDLASKAVSGFLVSDAPADYDLALESVPVARGWVRVLVFLAALVLSWTLVLLVAVAVWHATSRLKSRRLAPEAAIAPFWEAAGRKAA